MPKTTDWTDEETLAYVLGHEYVHIRRFDAVTKLALTCALCVHWFNPMAWILYVLANRDIELSCDEAVIRGFGEHTKSAYAMTLIRMEETKSGLSPLCNNFSKNAIEERIVAIMKIKKTSLVAIFLAIGLIAGVTTTFATSAQAAAVSDTDKNDTANTAQTTMRDYTVMSYTDPADGKTYYSMDEGNTWTPMTDEELSATSGWDDVEWWTAEEYAAWLEQEKAMLQSIIGEQGWNPTEGWFTWTQEMVEEAIARYEQTLKDIQAGQKISKPTADGDTMIQFGYDPSLQVTTTDTTTDTTTVLGSVAMMDSITDNTVMPGSGQALTSELLAAYKTHGLTYDEAKGAFYFNGKLVGIEEYSQEEFDGRFMMTPATAEETATFGFVGSTGGMTFEEHFAKYKDFGITYVEAQNASGQGNVYLNGQLVSRFSDVSPDGSAFSFTSADKGGIAVRTVYDSNGQLSGVETVRE